MTVPMAVALKSKLDQAVAQIDEEKRFCTEKQVIATKSCLAKQDVLKDEAKEREILLRKALVQEQAKSAAIAQEAGEQELQRYLWAAGGVGVGVLVGVVGGVGGYLYLTRP